MTISEKLAQLADSYSEEDCAIVVGLATDDMLVSNLADVLIFARMLELKVGQKTVSDDINKKLDILLKIKRNERCD